VSGFKRKPSASRGGSLVALLFIVFLVLKLTGVIDWSWWWVTSPLWLSALAFFAGLLLFAVIGFAIWRAVKHFRKKRGERAASTAQTSSVSPTVTEVPSTATTSGQAPHALPETEPGAQPGSPDDSGWTGGV
jgi:phosphoglycerol transferase MdoB-like AlkP superfamily enzyme